MEVILDPCIAPDKGVQPHDRSELDDSEQKYQVIHYIRQKFLVDKNPSQHFEITDKYLAGIKPKTYPGPRPRERQLRPYMKMDFGNNMNYTFEVGPDNIAYKAITVRLDPGPEGVAKGNTWLAYDHDLMRVAAVWQGDEFIDWRSIAMDGSHGTHPKIRGETFLLNPKAPGWAKPDTDDFKDPRFLGRDNKPYGPLQRLGSLQRALSTRGTCHYRLHRRQTPNP